MAGSNVSTIKMPLPEQIIGGRYKLLHRLGHGGMGLVFLAEQLGVGNRVAVKFLDPEPTTDDTRIARFLREAKVGLEVKHPGAAQLLDLGRDESMRLFLVFEYVEGEDLREVLRREGRLGWEEARDITLRIAEALAFAHDKGIVHRDIKPENVRVRRDLAGTHVKVLDFGIARLLKDGGVRLTAEGTLAGTPRYMSPEQIRDGEIDARTDVYALGLVFYEMLSGTAAFGGKNISQILLKQVQDPLPSLSAVDPQLQAPQVDEFLATACAKNQGDRFQSMAALVRALKGLSVDAARWPPPQAAGPVSTNAPTRGARPAHSSPKSVDVPLSDTFVKPELLTEPSFPQPAELAARPAPKPGPPVAEEWSVSHPKDVSAKNLPETRAAPRLEVITEPDREAVQRRQPTPSSKPNELAATVKGTVPAAPPRSRAWVWVVVVLLALVAAAAAYAWRMR